MQPSEQLTDVLDERGTVFDEWVGDNFAEITWDGDSVQLVIDSVTITDVEQWWEATSPQVLAFFACVGKGELGPDEDAGILGWFYLDDFGALRMELEAGDTYARFKLPVSGAPAVAASVCRCRTIPLGPHGCINRNCDHTDECPASAGHYCEWAGAQVAAFEAAFNAVNE